jgi:hypothetical protein
MLASNGFKAVSLRSIKYKAARLAERVPKPGRADRRRTRSSRGDRYMKLIYLF